MENNQQTPKIVFVGCFLFFACVILFACLGTFGAIYRENIPLVKDYFPTRTPTLIPTPTSTPVPHILVHLPPKDLPVLKEDFATNQNEWSSYYFHSKVEVKDGKLALEAFDSRVGVGECFCKAPFDKLFSGAYYIQADLSTNTSTRESYGLVFGLSEDQGFYTFTINSFRGAFFLDKAVENGWVSLFSGHSKIIKPYPQSNTLSIYVDQGKMDLFINGQPVTTYEDKNPIKEGKVGVYVNDGGFQLVVDNLFAYQTK